MLVAVRGRRRGVPEAGHELTGGGAGLRGQGPGRMPEVVQVDLVQPSELPGPVPRLVEGRSSQAVGARSGEDEPAWVRSAVPVLADDDRTDQVVSRPAEQKPGSNLGSVPGDTQRVWALTGVMPSSPIPRGAHRLVLEISRDADRRLEGRISDTPEVWLPFSGVLELLKALEDLLEDA
jgi:hypothetical protein